MDAETRAYHERQKTPYEITERFADFIAPLLLNDDHVLDVGCGGGEPTKYLARRFPQCQWSGCDKDWQALEMAHQAPQNVRFFYYHAIKPMKLGLSYQGVVLQQTLHTFANPTFALTMLVKHLAPRFIAASTLIYEGNIDCIIRVREYDRPRQSFYNILALPHLTDLMRQLGYETSVLTYFIGVEIPPSESYDVMRSRTVTLNDHRAVMSGPLLLPWSFVAFTKS